MISPRPRFALHGRRALSRDLRPRHYPAEMWSLSHNLKPYFPTLISLSNETRRRLPVISKPCHSSKLLQFRFIWPPLNKTASWTEKGLHSAQTQASLIKSPPQCLASLSSSQLPRIDFFHVSMPALLSTPFPFPLSLPPLPLSSLFFSTYPFLLQINSD